MSVRLDCPLCGAVVADGVDEVTPGACSGCGARYEGGDGDVPGAVATALGGFGAAHLDATHVATAIFRLTPDQSVERGVAITSDSRDDFYRWWMFVRAPEDGHAAAVAELT
jgi:hypothetical protein